MTATHTLANIAKSAWRIGVQPVQFARNRAARYRAAGLETGCDLPVLRVDAMAGHEGAEARCAYMIGLSDEHLGEYRHIGQDWRWRPWLGTAAAIGLGDYASPEVYLDAVGRRTGKAFTRSVAKARRLGYGTSLFPPQSFATSLDRVLASRIVRSGGLVPYAVLPGRRPAPDAALPAGYRPRLWCNRHWTLHFGVFGPGRGGAGAQTEGPGEQRAVVGFVKLRRVGTLVHALQIMGHGDHLAAGVNDLLQADLMAWLIGGGDGLATGVTHYLYGAIEHSGEGLAQWKLRRGFVPMLIERAG